MSYKASELVPDGTTGYVLLRTERQIGSSDTDISSMQIHESILPCIRECRIVTSKLVSEKFEERNVSQKHRGEVEVECKLTFEDIEPYTNENLDSLFIYQVTCFFDRKHTRHSDNRLFPSRITYTRRIPIDKIFKRRLSETTGHTVGRQTTHTVTMFEN
jgi:hypothetical protein